MASAPGDLSDVRDAKPEALLRYQGSHDPITMEASTMESDESAHGEDITRRLLVIGINYPPEHSGIAPYTAGFAEAMAAAGDDVRVLTGYPHYPEWRIRDDWTGGRSVSHEGGVVVEHLRHLVPGRAGSLPRLLMELQFGLRATLRRWHRPDAIVLVSPALFSTAIAVTRARAARIPTCVWVQDIYSLGVVQSGGGGAIVGRAMMAIEKRVLRSADRVIAIHERFKRYLVEELGVDPDRVDVVRNWSHVAPPEGVDRLAVRARHGWSPEDIVVLHAGNMGAKQGLENVVKAARLAEDRGSRVLFVLLGHGNQRAVLERANTSGRLRFLDPVDEAELMPVLASADILLVNELPGLTEMSVPSKLTSYFATGQPVLVATDASSVTAEEVERSGAGIRVDAATPGGLVDAAELIAADPELSRRLGEAGFRFRQLNLSHEAATAGFRDALGRTIHPVPKN